MAVATLLMHPLMVEIVAHDLSWRSNTPVRDHARYEIGVNKGRMQRFMRRTAVDWDRISDTLGEWLVRRGLRVSERRRALLDLRTKRFWHVDFVCETNSGECCLVCLFHGGRNRFAMHEVQYAERLRRLAWQTYRTNVRVLGVKIRGKDWSSTSTWEAGAELRNAGP